jgi:flagellar secretion chaperone FliS
MNTETTTINAYLQSKVMSASAEELRLMLIEGAIKYAKQGKAGLEQQDFEMVYEGMYRSKEIILELLNGLRAEVAPELCENLKSLYTYMYKRLMDASLEKDPAIAQEIIELLEFDRETWLLLMEQLKLERGDMSVHPEEAPPLATGTDGMPMSRFSAEG